jgi:hypothetical protein
MERHCIVDFAFDPVDRTVWGLLDRPPSRAWIGVLELLVAAGIGGANVSVEQRRLSLPVGSGDECDALGALLGLIARANDTAVSATLEEGR